MLFGYPSINCVLCIAPATSLLIAYVSATSNPGSVAIRPVPPIQGSQVKALPAKGNYSTSLVDQAVESLGDIRKPDGIPSVFATATWVVPTPKQAPQLSCIEPNVTRQFNQRLPSPSLPSTQAVTASCPSESRRRMACFSSPAGASAQEQDLFPIKMFLHEAFVNMHEDRQFGRGCTSKLEEYEVLRTILLIGANGCRVLLDM